MSSPLLDRVRAPFRALAETFIPEAAGCSPDTWARLEDIVERALAARPAAMQRQLVLFIRVLDLLARARFGKRLAELEPARRTAFLEAFANSRVLLLRRGVWGLRTLVMMGYYGQPEIQQALGYRATPAGWEARP